MLKQLFTSVSVKSCLLFLGSLQIMTIAAMEPTEAVAGKKTFQTPSLHLAYMYFVHHTSFTCHKFVYHKPRGKFTNKFSSPITFFSSNRHFPQEINRLRNCFVPCKACKKMHGHKGSVG